MILWNTAFRPHLSRPGMPHVMFIHAQTQAPTLSFVVIQLLLKVIKETPERSIGFHIEWEVETCAVPKVNSNYKQPLMTLQSFDKDLV